MAKAYQLHLTEILQRFITNEQFTFIKGWTFDHSLFLTNEVLAEATQHDEDYIFLKLDMVKAFDKIEWGFLLNILKKFGFGPKFLQFIHAAHESTSSSILINGQKSKSFKIKRSVRQDCPLSPLPFVIALDALSNMLHNAKDCDQIVGVKFWETDVHNLHSFYADDIHLIVKACPRMISTCQQLFETFGMASDLVCDWKKTKAINLTPGPIPHFLSQIGWIWESHDTTSKYLGIFMVNQISTILTNRHLLSLLEK